MRVAKTKALISFAVTAKLICVFVFAYADCWFSHEAAQMSEVSVGMYRETQNFGSTCKLGPPSIPPVDGIIYTKLVAFSVRVLAVYRKA